MTPQIPGYLLSFESIVRPLVTIIALGLIWLGAARMPASAKSRYVTAGVLSAALIGWVAVAQYLGAANTYFATADTAQAGVPTVLLGLLIPLAVAAIALWRSESIARLVSAICSAQRKALRQPLDRRRAGNWQLERDTGGVAAVAPSRCGRKNHARVGGGKAGRDHITSRAAGPDQSPSPSGLSRRRFLQAGAAAGGGLMLSMRLPSANGEAAAADTGGFAPNAFVRIGGDGQIVLTMPYVEMGQGTYTAIAMLIAEELEVGLLLPRAFGAVGTQSAHERRQPFRERGRTHVGECRP
jgi:Molybdopterin-binding domain of aldehyde dehydrogenase